MRQFYNKAQSAFALLRCATVMLNSSIIIFFSSFIKKGTQHRLLTNRVAHQAALKILNITKAKYSADYIEPLVLNKNEIYIFMSNHQSLFDIPLIYANLQTTIRPVTKAELFKIPIFGRAMRVGECIVVDRKDPAKRQKFLDQAQKVLRNGVSVWIFPEGMRSSSNTLLPFKSGGFQLAKDMSAKIIPVAVIDTHTIAPPERLLPALNQEVKICFGKLIDANEFDSVDALKETVRGSIQGLIAHGQQSKEI